MRASSAELEVVNDGAPLVRASSAYLEVLLSLPRPRAVPPLQLRRLKLRRLS